MMSVLMWQSCLSISLLSPRARALGLSTFFLWLPQSLTADEHRHSFELATARPPVSNLPRSVVASSIACTIIIVRHTIVVWAVLERAYPRFAMVFHHRSLISAVISSSTPCFRQTTALPARAAMTLITASPTDLVGRGELTRPCSTARRPVCGTSAFSTRCFGMAVNPRSKSN